MVDELTEKRRSADYDIGEMKATINYTAHAMRDMTLALKETSATNSEFREHVIGQLSSIDEKLVAFAEYRTKCESDRDELDDRASKLETWRTRQAGQVSGVVAASFAIGSLAEALLHGLTGIRDLFR